MKWYAQGLNKPRMYESVKMQSAFTFILCLTEVQFFLVELSTWCSLLDFMEYGWGCCIFSTIINLE
jgi:hypothetical protein